MRTLLLFVLAALLALPAAASTPRVDLVKVAKAQRKLYLMSAGSVVREFGIALGANPVGHKLQQGDRRTPEGRYVLDYKKDDSAFYRAIHVSYPSPADIERARRRGVSPGGQIMIHGQKNGMEALAKVTQRFDWTHGCIALTNEDMDQLWQLVPVGVPIEIVP